jgi:alkylhydroperoxidase family enzyme
MEELSVIPPHRHAAAAERLRGAVLDGPGHTDPELRRAVAAYSAELWWAGRTRVRIPAELRGYVDKLVTSPYKLLDENTEALRAAGYDDDQIFELSVASALGCGLRALESGLSATRGDG